MGTQVEIAKRAGVAQPTIANIMSGRRRPSWKLAKKLAEATGTSPELWLDGTPDQIRCAVFSKGACEAESS